MGDRFTVDTEELDDVVADLVSAERALQALAGDLDRSVRELQLEWHGLAAAAQDAAHREWRRGHARMHAALGDLRAAAADAGAGYVDAADANLVAWRRVSS